MNEPTDEMLETISDAGCQALGDSSKITFNGVTFYDIYRHDACNHTFTGVIETNGQKFGFIIESGNRNGTVVHEWGTPENVGTFQHPKPTIFTFVPINPNLKTERPMLWAAYLHWKKQDWFTEKEKGLNYDTHFAPGEATTKHYAEWAAKKGMKIGVKE